MSSLKLLLGVFALVMVSNPAYAEVVLAYDLNGVPLTAPTSVNATTAATGVTGQALSRGAGIAASNLTNGFSSSGWDGAASLASAIADGNYYQFGLSLNSGYRAGPTQTLGNLG